MASAFSHAIVAMAMGRAFRNEELRWRELFLGALCSVVPDLDVMGFYFGIQYGDVWGHRGMTHSIVFAARIGVFAGQQIAEKLSVGIVRRRVKVYTNSALDPVLLVRSIGQTR